ncbi:DNA repair and transcription factor Ada [Aspergillus eucalypticola CBS 122712]|uniref:DNA repair and transcription factor Ada n=1 Tax=Aspergillus eucalypticola (strain CBS 122712 / IBT 29274) TaxID=1448314 RepID=A0A317VG25_ASPEC|nr:DNA repair and transcription factor Ada [Aspergillus eucalypticola CBS 122712]PWY73333.1 DNA repair and transcription factor Ada [Aspergillus eucalypticola CBS 122712]
MPPSQNLPPLPLPKPLPSTSSTSTRWLAIQTRDPKYTSTFVYAVLTTKIYCRPTCPARLARRANVRFYDTASQAERAGFRPCKRCKPEVVIDNSNNHNLLGANSNTTTTPSSINGGTTIFHPQIHSIQKACQTIRASVQAGSKPTLRMLAAEAGLTPSHFHRVFKRVVGVTVGRYMGDIITRGKGMGGAGEVVEGACRNWVGGVGDGCGDDGNGAVLWNDFDVLLAAEEDDGFVATTTTVAMQDVHPVQDEELLAWRAVGSYGVGIGGGCSVDETFTLGDGAL